MNECLCVSVFNALSQEIFEFVDKQNYHRLPFSLFFFHNSEKQSHYKMNCPLAPGPL